ncbi:MAG: transferrin-binding protein-like solute binding protein [Aestuariibacter sp.]|nr:transferrin-binding protein-like solute binding protein [Aestuariibacter sp.]
MKFSKSTLAAAVTVALFGASGQAFANACEGDKNECYNQIQVYGDVTVADDSVDSWGPWGQFAQPAAGPAVPVVAALAPTIPGGPNVFDDADDFVPKVDEPPAVGSACEAGQSCFYATYARYQYDGGEYYYYGGDGGAVAGPVPANFPNNLPAAAAGQLEGQFGVSAVSPDASHPDRSSEQMSTGHYHPNYNSGYGTGIADYIHMGGWSDYDGGEGYSNVSYYLPYVADDQMLFGYWSDGNDTYTDGDSDCYYYSCYSYDGGEGTFVGGIATAQADLAALNAGNVQASYTGNTAGAPSYYNRSPVSMDVNFGSATWSASVNGGSDGSFTQETDSFGNDYVLGQVGFNASGTISGANIASTSVSAPDATSISGSMNGTFFGANAAAVGGIIDVNKSTADYSNSRYVDTFQAVKVAPN